MNSNEGERYSPAAKTILTLFLLFSFASVAFAGVPQDISENIKVKYQLTDVKVKDGAGKHISGLTKADFQLLVDGKPFEVKSSDEVVSESPRSERIKKYMSALNNTPEGVAPPALPVAPRFIVIILDRGNLGDRAFIESKNLAKRFVKETLLPFDRVAVFMFNGTVKVLTGPTTERNRILDAIDRASAMRANDLYHLHQFEVNPLIQVAAPQGLEGNSATKPGNVNSPTLASRGHEAELLTRNYFDIFKILAKVFKNMPEKKSVLFFSEGFARSSTFIKMHEDYAASLNFFNSGNTSFFSIKRGPRIPEWSASLTVEQSRFEGTPSMPSAIRRILMERDSMLREVADNTNGEFFDQVIKDDDILNTLGSEIGNYYLLGFIPPRTEDRTHKIEVAVKGHPEYKITHRRKFMTPKSFNHLNREEKRIHLEEGFLTPGFHQQLSMKVFTDNYSVQSKPRMTVAFEIPADKVGKTGRGEHELELVINIEDAKGNIRHRVHKTFNSRDKIENGQIHLLEDIPVPREPYAVYLAVRDNSSGERSTWSKTIYPKERHMKISRAKSPFSNISANENSWKSKMIKDGVKIKN